MITENKYTKQSITVLEANKKGGWLCVFFFFPCPHQTNQFWSCFSRSRNSSRFFGGIFFLFLIIKIQKKKKTKQKKLKSGMANLKPCSMRDVKRAFLAFRKWNLDTSEIGRRPITELFRVFDILPPSFPGCNNGKLVWRFLFKYSTCWGGAAVVTFVQENRLWE